MNKKQYKHYPEETKRNVVAAVRSGISQRNITKRLGIPKTTVNDWVHSTKYADVTAAPPEVLQALPPVPGKSGEKGGQKMVKVGPAPAAVQEKAGHIRITFGRLAFESDRFTSDDIAMIVRALEDSNVL